MQSLFGNVDINFTKIERFVYLVVVRKNSIFLQKFRCWNMSALQSHKIPMDIIFIGNANFHSEILAKNRSQSINFCLIENV